jgi:RNA 2',3'-cyclic 3'-phosphodiesterase
MRVFVAAEPSEHVRTAAASATQRLRERLDAARAAHGIRWVPPQNLHLTVWFLGEVSDARAAAVIDALRPAMQTPAFDLNLAGFGAFPPSGPPRVLWIGVARGLDELAAAHEEVGARLHPWGFPPEGRAYSAHLTIARVKEPPHGAARAALRQAIAHEPAETGSCRIDALTVFRSRASPRGAVYDSLLRVPLS